MNMSTINSQFPTLAHTTIDLTLNDYEEENMASNQADSWASDFEFDLSDYFVREILK